MSNTEIERDHLFISYASEDAALARWLALRLTAEGYRVWCDQFELLGGESYPKDIDAALTNRTFRLLALMSRHSVSKDNPVKERTKALNIGRARGEQMLIPLKVDDIRAEELDWMTADLTWVPFHRSWAAGLAQLIEKLERIAAPRSDSDLRSAAIRALRGAPLVREEPEPLTLNWLPVVRLPDHLLVLEGSPQPPAPGPRSHAPAEAAVYSLSATRFLALQPPDGSGRPGPLRVVDRVSMRDAEILGIRTRDVVAALLRRHSVAHARARGLVWVPHKPLLTFPPKLLKNDWLSFPAPPGGTRRVQVRGTRKWFRQGKPPTRFTHSLAVGFRPRQNRFGEWSIELTLTAVTGNDGGGRLPPRSENARRKKVTKDWFNEEWWLRLLAVTHFLAEGRDTIQVGAPDEHQIVLGGRLIEVVADRRLDESLLRPVRTETDDAPAPEGPRRRGRRR